MGGCALTPPVSIFGTAFQSLVGHAVPIVSDSNFVTTAKIIEQNAPGKPKTTQRYLCNFYLRHMELILIQALSYDGHGKRFLCPKVKHIVHRTVCS